MVPMFHASDSPNIWEVHYVVVGPQGKTVPQERPSKTWQSQLHRTEKGEKSSEENGNTKDITLLFLHEDVLLRDYIKIK